MLLDVVHYMMLVVSTNACMRVSPPNPGIPVTPACQKCAQNLITKTTDGTGAQDFENDDTAVSNGCNTRTLTCMGINAKITINGPTSGITLINDGSNTATISVTCNGDTMKWMYMDNVVTQLECASDNPQCLRCEGNLIMVAPGASAISKEFDVDVTEDVGGCSVRSFECTGIDAAIKVNGEALPDITDECTGTASINTACNANGDAWTYMGNSITKLECTATQPPEEAPACQRCAQCLIDKTLATPNSIDFASDDTEEVMGCNVRTFECQGPRAAIELNGGGQISDEAQGTPGMVKLSFACNDAGTAWEFTDFFPPIPITKLDCSSFP